MVVHHYFPLGSGNVGDHMVAHAIRSQLTRHLQPHLGPVRFVDFPVNDRYEAADRPIGLMGDNLARSNAEADLVVIGGSNLLEPRKPRPDKTTGKRAGRWSVFTTLEAVRQLRVPVLLVGMGTGSSFGESIRPYLEPTTSEIRELFARSFAHSVRDTTTVRQLAGIGVQTQCTGCPVTFLTPAEIKAQPASLPLAVSLPPAYIRRSLLGKWFMAGTLSYIHSLHREGVKVLVTLHEDRDVPFAREHISPGIEVFYTDDLHRQLDRFSEIRGMVGFRLHAALTAWGLGKPVIPVGIDWRGRGFIETIAADDYSITPGYVGRFAALRSLTRTLLSGDPALLARQAAAKAHLMALHEDFLRKAAESLRDLVNARRQQPAGTAPRTH